MSNGAWLADLLKMRGKGMAARCGVDDPERCEPEAIGALECFEGNEGPFGDPAYTWDVDAAKVIAREEMSYWEE